MHQATPSSVGGQASASSSLSGAGSFEAVVGLLDKQQDKMVGLLREEREEAEVKAEKARLEFEARYQSLQTEMEKRRQESEAKAEQQRQEMEQRLVEAKPQRAAEVITEGQLESLQSRLQALHEAKLLSEDDLCKLEDTVADCIEVLPTADVREHVVDQVVRMVRLSEKMAIDGSLARQLRRKFA
jgi:hypothetical protein